MPVSLGQVFCHRQKFIVLGKSLTSPPWMNSYLILDSGSDILMLPVMSFWREELERALGAASIEIVPARHWNAQMRTSKGMRRMYESDLERAGRR